MDDASGMREFLEAIYVAIRPRIRKGFASLSTGTVQRVDGKTAHVVIAGDSKATPTRRCCQAEAGDVALVARQGTTLYTIGVLQ